MAMCGIKLSNHGNLLCLCIVEHDGTRRNALVTYEGENIAPSQMGDDAHPLRKFWMNDVVEGETGQTALAGWKLMMVGCERIVSFFTLLVQQVRRL